MHHAMKMDELPPQQALQGQSIYHLDSSWTAQDGSKVPLSRLRGFTTLIAMVYTSCPDACPMTISDLQRIEKSLTEPERKRVRFALFSFDSKRDTPAVLKRFAKAHELDSGRWTLFHGSPIGVRKLAAVLGIRYKQDKNGDFSHSNLITLIDSGGVIQYQQVGLRQDPTEMLAQLRRLLKVSPSQTLKTP
jgi:protein SCO1/2